jgi:hypothetical protein
MDKLSSKITNLMCVGHTNYAVDRCRDSQYMAEHFVEAMLKGIDQPLWPEEKAAAMSLRLGVNKPVCCIFGDRYMRDLFDHLQEESSQ